MLEIVRPLDIAVMVLYFIGVALAGVYFAKKNKNTEDYFLGGRNFPSWAIGLSMVGTSISSITYMAYPGDAFKTTWLRVLPCFTLPLGILIASIWFLPFFRRSKITSAYEYLEDRFGPNTRLYAAIIFVIGQIFRIGTVLFLLALLMKELTGLPIELCLLISGAFVSFYTVLGGIEAVVWTDVVQTIILVLGGFLILAFIVAKLPHGFPQIFSEAIADGKFRFADATPNLDGTLTFEKTSWALSLTRKTASMMLLMGLCSWLTEYSSNQNVIQRYCASRSPRDAKKAMWMCGIASVSIWTYFMFLGTALYVFFKVAVDDPHAFDIQIGANGKSAEQILPYFVLTYLPAGFAGLVIAAVLAAAMSSLDSSINAIATVSVVDIYRRHMVKNADEKHYLRVARTIAIIASLLMISTSYIYAVIPMKTFQDMGIILGGLLGGGLFGLFMLGFLTTRGDGRAVAWGIVATFLFTIWMTIREFLPRFYEGTATSDFFPYTDSYYTGILANLMIFLIGYFVAAFFLPARNRDMTNLTVWTQDGTPLV